MKQNEKNFFYFLKTYGLNSIFFKNLVKIFTFFLIPIMTIIFLCYGYFVSVLNKNLENESIKNISTVSAVIDNIIREAKQTTIQLSFDNDTALLMMEENINDQLPLAIRIHERIKNITNVYSYIDSIYVYSDVAGVILNTSTTIPFDDFPDNSWYSHYSLANNGDLTFISRIKNNNYPYLFTIIRPIFLGSQKIGAIVVNMNIEKLCEIMNKNNSVENIIILLDDYIAYADDSTLIFKDTLEVFKSENDLTKTTSGVSTLTFNDKKMHTIHCNSSVENITYLSMVPESKYQASIKSEFLSLKLILVIIILVCIGIALLMSTISFDAVKKIIMMIDYPESRTEQEMSKNEISYILNNVIDENMSNSKLELKLAEQLKNLKKATTTALQSQINSHFLCNTLDLINWQCFMVMNGDNEISRMISLLGKLVKNGLNINSNLTTIQEEVEHTKTYISLSKLHYTDKFDAHWNIDKDIYECDIVRLTLQPIIENAVEHGMRNLKRRGNIYIDITSDNDNIYVNVADDGPGMSDEGIALLNDSISAEVQKKTRHIGLANINTRIHLLFGDKYGVKVSRAEIGGLMVSITIPKSDCDLIV